MKQQNSYMKPNKTCFLPSHIVTQVIHKVHPAQWPRMVRLPPHSSTTITQEHPLRTWARSGLVSPRWKYLHQMNWWKGSIESNQYAIFQEYKYKKLRIMKKNTIYNDCSLGNSGIMYTILEFMQATRGLRQQYSCKQRKKRGFDLWSCVCSIF